jgi:hypothetical protein
MFAFGKIRLFYDSVYDFTRKESIRNIEYMKHVSLFRFTAITLLYFFVFLASCARMSAPAGGPKDEAPPVPLKSKPINYSTHFAADKIIVQFDEFIVLKNVNQELLVSPPLPEKPGIKLRGKNLLIHINNQLKDSTTYNFNFYNAIVDLNENNPLTNFQFEFSTGPVFDSLYVGGVLSNAFDYKTEPSIFVMMYEQFNDSIPRTQIPDYVAKTDADGRFFVTNLKNKPYYIFGLRDMNNNMKFDLPNEGIAFMDSAFSPGFKEITVIDTLKLLDFISPDLQDTVYRDSVVQYQELVTTIGDIRLFMFVEDHATQYFKQVYRPERQQLIFSFNLPVDENFKLTPIGIASDDDWFVKEPLIKNDSLMFWMKDSALFNSDSLFFSLSYTMKDSTRIDFVRTDTVLAYYQPKEEASKSKAEQKKGGRFNLNVFANKEEEAIVDSTPPPSELTFATNAKGMFDLNKPVELLARFPIAKVQKEQIVFNKIVDDTLRSSVNYEILNPEFSLRNYLLHFKVEEDEKYELILHKGAFTDIYNNTNDSLKYTFTSRGTEYYSNIQMHIMGVIEPSVIQLMDEKEVVLDERKIWSDTTFTYDFLQPKKYIFKLFFDLNQNDKWDTGNFKEFRQPEPVFYFPQEVETKGNWDMEYEWELFPVGPPNLKKGKKTSQGAATQPKFGAASGRQ